MTQATDYEARALDAVTRAVADALERKRRLGQYAVVWREGRALCIGPDAPAPNNQRGTESAKDTWRCGGARRGIADDDSRSA